MTSHTVSCPSCKVELTIPDSAGGKRLRCPKCATRFYAPKAGSAAPSRPAPQKAKVPPSSAVIPLARRDEPDVPRFSGDLRDLDDASDAPPSRRPAAAGPRSIADVSALLADDGPARPSRRPGAEARKQARPCPSCGSIVPVGMSLCNACGLDLDTGLRIDIDLADEPEAAPLPEIAPGPPASLIVLGLMTMMAAAVLTVFAFLKLDRLGGTALGLVSLFGVYASILFLAGKSIRLMTVALMLGALVDILTMIALPVVVANTFDVVTAPEMEGLPGVAPGDGAKPGDDEALPKVQHFQERLDMTRIIWGVVILVVDAIVLAYINSPPVRRQFERRPRHNPLDEGPLML